MIGLSLQWLYGFVPCSGCVVIMFSLQRERREGYQSATCLRRERTTLWSDSQKVVTSSVWIVDGEGSLPPLVVRPRLKRNLGKQAALSLHSYHWRVN